MGRLYEEVFCYFWHYYRVCNVIFVNLTPVVINTMQVSIATGAQKDTILELMRQRSAAFGTNVNKDGVITISS